MTATEIFLQELRKARKDFPAVAGTMIGRRVEILALERFEADCRDKDSDPRFEADAPKHARRVIVQHYAAALA